MADDKKRITFRVDQEVYDELNSIIPWGQQQHVFEAIANDLLFMLKEHDSSIVLGAIVSESIGIKDIVDYDKRKRNE